MGLPGVITVLYIGVYNLELPFMLITNYQGLDAVIDSLASPDSTKKWKPNAAWVHCTARSRREKHEKFMSPFPHQPWKNVYLLHEKHKNQPFLDR